MQYGSAKVYSMTDQEICIMLDEILIEVDESVAEEKNYYGKMKQFVEIVKKHLRGKLALSATKE